MLVSAKHQCESVIGIHMPPPSWNSFPPSSHLPPHLTPLGYYRAQVWVPWVMTNSHCFCIFSSVQLLSRVRLFATPWTAARQASYSITNSSSSLKLMSIESVMPSKHLILCHPLLFPPSIFPSIRVFQISQLFPSGGQILEFQLQHQSFQCIFRTDFL